METSYSANNENDFNIPNNDTSIDIVKKNSWTDVNDWCNSLISALTFVVILFAFIFRVVMVDGTSMVPTLHDKDRLIISSLFCNPEEQDIIVISTNGESAHPIIKRVIGTGGQTVEIDYVNSTINIYDPGSDTPRQLDEPYINGVQMVWNRDELPGGIEGNEPRYIYDSTGTIIEKAVYPVPEGCYFVLGDNRNGSKDSRFMDVGFIERGQIIGEAILRVYPLNGFGVVE